MIAVSMKLSGGSHFYKMPTSMRLLRSMSAEIAKSRVNFYHLNINYGPRTFVKVQMNKKKAMLMNPARNEWFGYPLGDSAKWDGTKWRLKSTEHRVCPGLSFRAVHPYQSFSES